MWAIAAVCAAMFWGLSYAVSERLMKTGFAPAFIMAVASMFSLPAYVLIAFRRSSVPEQIGMIRNNPKMFVGMVMTATLYIIANYLVFWAIKHKDATSVNLIEISYPLFTLLFAWLLFSDLQLNWGIGIGAMLILCGMGCVILFSK